MIQSKKSKYKAEHYKWISKYRNNHIKPSPEMAMDDIKYSLARRMGENTTSMKYNYLFERADQLIVVFKISVGDDISQYGQLFMNKTSENKTIIPTYYNTGGTFVSQDGEYRMNIQEYSRLTEVEEHIAKLVPKGARHPEDILTNMLETQEIDLQTFVIGYDKETADAITEIVDNLRLSIRLFIIAWCTDWHRIVNDTIENHINPVYQKIMNTMPDPHVECGVGYNLYIEPPAMGEIMPLSIGHKQLLLTSRELRNIYDIKYSAWRELYIQIRCSSLVANYISPSFSFVNMWFLTQTHPTYWDNPAQEEKYMLSNIAVNIANDLDTLIGKTKSKGVYHSHDFNVLANYLNQGVRFADDYIILSNMALIISQEHMGTTLRDAPRRDKTEMFSNLEIFQKYMFEIIYASYVMKEKCGVIHGDLHINNITMYVDYKWDKSIQKHYVIYVIGNKMYAFKHRGVYISIIDFSRAMITDKSALLHDFGNHTANMFLRQQYTRIISIINSMFPEIINLYKDSNIEDLIERQQESVYNAMVMLDIYKTMVNIVFMIDTDKVSTIVGIRDFAIKLQELSKHLFTTHIHAALEGNPIESKPIMELFELFQHQLHDKQKNIKVVDIFSANNELKYTMDKYTNYPDILKMDKIIEMRKRFGIDIDKIRNNAAKVKSTQQPDTLRNATDKNWTTNKLKTDNAPAAWMFQ